MLERPEDIFNKEKHPMRKTLAIALMLTASLGLAACDKKSEDKAQDANQHAEQAQQKMNEAQDKVNEAAKENAEAAKDQVESNKAAAEEAAKEAAPKTN
jgi:protein involved in sex pheromone biosynthesis